MRRSNHANPVRRWVLGCGGGVLLLIAVLVIGGWYVYHLWRSTPEGWQRVETMRRESPPRQRETLAAEVEKRVVAALSFAGGMGGGTTAPRVSPATDAAASAPSASAETRATDERKVIRLSNQEINAWLENRLPLWAAHCGTPIPPQVRSVGYWPENGRPVLGVRVALEDATQVFSMTFDLIVRGRDAARLELGDLRGGRLPMSWDQLAKRGLAKIDVQDRSDVARWVEHVMSGGEFAAVLPIDHERQVRLVEFSVDADAVTLTFVNEPVDRD